MAHNRTPVPDQAAGNVLIIFVRLPVPGEVKTRLARGIGAVSATEHYRAFAEWVFDHTATPAPGVWRRWACFSPRSALSATRTWLREYHVDHWLPQAPGDLGVRLMAVTGAAFHARASKVIVIGTDCLEVDQETLDDAFEALEKSDIVIGPSLDGGYYLLGLKTLNPKMFQRIPWSTDQVFSATIARAQELGLKVAELPVKRDIDRPEDLNHLGKGFLAKYPEFAPDKTKTV
jgi:hypothetical protein